MLSLIIQLSNSSDIDVLIGENYNVYHLEDGSVRIIDNRGAYIFVGARYFVSLNITHLEEAG